MTAVLVLRCWSDRVGTRRASGCAPGRSEAFGPGLDRHSSRTNRMLPTTDAAVGDVESGPEMERYEIDHRTVIGPEHPVRQIARGTARSRGRVQRPPRSNAPRDEP